jgi:hypothetical protein
LNVRDLNDLAGPHYLLKLTACSLLVALVIGLPTDVIPTPLFGRMTPVRPADVVLLALTALASGALLATYLRRDRTERLPKAGLGAGALGYLAVGCPVCNKAVVLLLGTSGAVTTFEPLQPLLGALAVALTLVGLHLRIRALRRGCPVPA